MNRGPSNWKALYSFTASLISAAENLAVIDLEWTSTITFEGEAFFLNFHNCSMRLKAREVVIIFNM